MTVKPSGTVTFLFTDIEASTRRWEADPDSLRPSTVVPDYLMSRLGRHEGVLQRSGVELSSVVIGCAEAVQWTRYGDAALRRVARWGLRWRAAVSFTEVGERMVYTKASIVIATVSSACLGVSPSLPRT